MSIFFLESYETLEERMLEGSYVFSKDFRHGGKVAIGFCFFVYGEYLSSQDVSLWVGLVDRIATE